jgi:hypothetical protein
VDFTGLNKQTVRDAYPLPRIDDTLSALSGCFSYITTIDLASEYWKMPVAKEARHLTHSSHPLARNNGGFFPWEHVMPLLHFSEQWMKS